MTHFLWVEDFKASETNREDNIISSTVNLVFGSLFDFKNQEFEDEYAARKFLRQNGVFLKFNLLEALEFIRNPTELAKVDFIILDVDMPLKWDTQKDVNNYLPDLIKAYQSETELKKIAGYQIYIDLVIELGFPKSHILFCSNHAGYFEQFVGRFESANIKFPKLLQKEHDKEIKDWLTKAQSDYFVLRRGIIEGCKKLKEILPKDKEQIAFNNFVSENKVNSDEIRDYLDILENFLPLHQPENTAALYKLFIRTLSHEWEATDPKKIRGLVWIMKNVRNWITHNSTLFNALDEQMVAYLFMINMRVMLNFDEKVQSYEAILLKLFNQNALAEDIFANQISNKLLSVSKIYLDLKNIILDERQDKNNNVQDGFYFNELANNLQQSNSSIRNNSPLFYKLLYQMFWLTTSNPFISTGNRKNLLEIKFWNFDYGKKDDYLFELARHIYNRSFS
jgi:hypothetical protein